MVGEFNKIAWNSLISLAEEEISGKPAKNEDVADLLELICSKISYTEAVDNALDGISSTVALKIRSWLDWYVLYQEIEGCHVPRIFERLVTAAQLVCLSGVFALMFLYDRTIPSSVELDAKIAISMIGFVIFSVISFSYSILLKGKRIKVEVANLILNSVKGIHTNQRERI